MDWILSDAIRRHMMDENEGRRGVLIRGVTRGIAAVAAAREPAPARALQGRCWRAAQAQAGRTRSGAGPGRERRLPRSPTTSSSRACARTASRAPTTWSTGAGYAGYEPGDNVVNVFVDGRASTTEALEASRAAARARHLRQRDRRAPRPSSCSGILGHANDYRAPARGLGVNGDLHAVEGAGESEAGLVRSPAAACRASRCATARPGCSTTSARSSA